MSILREFQRIDSNDPVLAKLNAELTIVRAALSVATDFNPAIRELIVTVIRDGGSTDIQRLREESVPTVHIDALRRARFEYLKMLGVPVEP